jgi:glycine cleavage system H protein
VEIPEKLRYAASHEWVADNGDGTVTVGITAVATEQLGELVYVEMPGPGRRYSKGEACAVVESTKAASDVYAPVSGEVVAINERLSDAPQQVNESPYTDGWLFKLKASDPGELAALLDAARYREASGAP